jgi:rhomboid protease GluP
MREELVLTNLTEEFDGVEASKPSFKPTLIFPYPATAFLIIVNVSVFLVLPTAFEHDYPGNPIRLGALYPPLVLSGEWWRLITAGFVHLDLSHLLPNLIALWVLGKRVERLLGGLGMLTFYLSCEVVGAVALVIVNPFDVGWGASLSVVGLAGAVLIVYGTRFRSLSHSAKWKFGALLWVAAGLVRQEIAGTHQFPHTIGLLIGMSFAVAFTWATRKRDTTTIPLANS